MTLKFKRLGQFCDEVSARYQARINDQLAVNIYKCAYRGAWVFMFIEIETGYSLDYLTCDMLASIHHIETKKEIVSILQNEIVSDPHFLNEAKEEIRRMARIRNY